MALSRSTMSEMEQQVTNLVAGQSDEAELLRGYAKGKKYRTELDAKSYANQKAIIAALTKMNDFMGARLGRTRAQNGQVLFQTQEEIDTYNTYLMEIQRQAQIVLDLQERYQEDLQKNINRHYRV